jgi:hypothetical protein
MTASTQIEALAENLVWVLTCGRPSTHRPKDRWERDHYGHTDSARAPACGPCWTAQAQASLAFDPITLRLT